MKGDIVHILNRGVDKRKIFLSEGDYIRFVYNCYDFNNTKNAIESYYRRRKKAMSDVRRPTKDEIVDIISWSLLPNHFHILVQEKVDGGASLFSKKIVGGYTKYFNENNDRNGVLFQGRSKIIRVKRDEHFLYLPFYIMANPVGLIAPNYKTKGIKNFKKAIKFLEDYRYSSLNDFVDEGDFAFMANAEAFFKVFNSNKKQFKKDFREWLKEQ